MFPSTPLPWKEVPLDETGQLHPTDRKFILQAVNAHHSFLSFCSNCRWITPDKIDLVTAEAADLFRTYR